MYYINIFLFYSILGYIMESIFAFLTNKNFSSGILYGPWTIIYGLGALIVIFISKVIFRKLKISKFYKTIIIFFIVCIILSILEYLAGVSIEKIFKVVYWNYSNQKFSIGKYISLTMSLIWGLMSIIFIYIIKPKCDRFILKIPKIYTKLLLLFFVIDCIYTFINKL